MDDYFNFTCIEIDIVGDVTDIILYYILDAYHLYTYHLKSYQYISIFIYLINISYLISVIHQKLVFDGTVGGDSSSMAKLTVDDMRFLFQ